MGSEDFAYYTERIPGTFWFLGTRPPGVMDYPLNHHAKFDFNDDALAIGMEMHCEVALRFASLWDT
jgi:metal-dependent amidase/aminoacylase/carboxypeptidase family protein